MATANTTQSGSPPRTIEVSCHCSSIRLSVPRQPEYLNTCQCSICRRYGASWGYYTRHEITFLTPHPTANPGGLDVAGTRKYIWGDKEVAFVSCNTCGCALYWWPLTDGDEVGVNMSCVEDVEALTSVDKRITYGDAKIVREGVYDAKGPLRA